MMNLDQEYDLFKTICKYKSIEFDQTTDSIIQKLIKKGFQLKLKDNHYRLTKDLYILSADKIRSGLNSKSNSLIDGLDVIYETGSTNKTIVNKKPVSNYTVLLSESQTDGSGRRQKKWVSPLGENIYCSIKFQIENSNNIHFIPLLTAVSICKSLAKIGISDCRIKWPNDLYLEDKKLGGILVESRYNVDLGHTIIVGIGLNINMDSNQEIDQSWTSLYNNTNTIFNRNVIVSMILSDLIEKLESISQLKPRQFMTDWNPLDYLKGREVIIIETNSTYSAISSGISDDGALLVEYEKNNKKLKKKIYSADVSVNPLFQKKI